MPNRPPLEGAKAPTKMEQAFRLVDRQRDIATDLSDRGMVVQGLLQAQYLSRNVPEDAVFSVVPSLTIHPLSRLPIGGLRYPVTQYRDDRERRFSVDVPVYEMIGSIVVEQEPFDESEAHFLAEIITNLEFERQFGELPDLNKDLTHIIGL